VGAKWNEWDWDYVWHDLGGIGITALVVVLMVFVSGSWWVPLLMVPILTIGGVIREFKQHAWHALTAHQWLEGVLWGVGALKAALLGLIFLL
jgi:hypothetical protein